MTSKESEKSNWIFKSAPFDELMEAFKMIMAGTHEWMKVSDCVLLFTCYADDNEEDGAGSCEIRRCWRIVQQSRYRRIIQRRRVHVHVAIPHWNSMKIGSRADHDSAGFSSMRRLLLPPEELDGYWRATSMEPGAPPPLRNPQGSLSAVVFHWVAPVRLCRLCLPATFSHLLENSKNKQSQFSISDFRA